MVMVLMIVLVTQLDLATTERGLEMLDMEGRAWGAAYKPAWSLVIIVMEADVKSLVFYYTTLCPPSPLLFPSSKSLCKPACSLSMNYHHNHHWINESGSEYNMMIMASCTFPGQKPRCETCSQDQDHRIISSVQDLDENGAYADCFSYNRCLTTMMLFGIDSNDYVIRTWESPFFEIALTWRRSEGVSRTYIPLSVWYGNVSVIVVVLVFLGYFLQSKAEEMGKDKSGSAD